MLFGLLCVVILCTIGMNKINLRSGSFWKQTGLDYEGLFLTLREDRPETIYIIDNRILMVKLFKRRYKDEILVSYANCIEIVLHNEILKSSATLTNFSTDCDEAIEINGYIQVQDEKLYKRTPYYMETVDTIAKCFEIKRISLTDAAKSKLDYEIDISLYTVMKEEKTFYEKYGYTFCDNELNFDVQKRLLRTFPFDVFRHLLSSKDKKWVDERVRKLGKSYSSKTLGEFYVDVYDKYHVLDSTNRIRQLQNILNDDTKVWYSMVNVLMCKRQCLEKFY